MKFKTDNIGIYLVIAGILMVLLMAGTASRSSLSYDNHNNDFTLGITDYKTPIESGDTHFTVTTRIANPSGGSDGSMYAQCSLLDYNVNKQWIDSYSRQSSVVRNNCVADEPFTQTAKVTLASGDEQDVTFTLTVPSALQTQNAILWCGTFERCYNSDMTGLNAIGASDSDQRFVRVVAEGETTVEAQQQINATAAPVHQCSLNQDCPAYLLGAIKCDSGYCVDIPAKDINFDNATIIQWVQAHSIIVWIVGIALILVGVYFAYDDKNKIF
jgi:hypothetical protein